MHVIRDVIDFFVHPLWFYEITHVKDIVDRNALKTTARLKSVNHKLLRCYLHHVHTARKVQVLYTCQQLARVTVLRLQHQGCTRKIR